MNTVSTDTSKVCSKCGIARPITQFQFVRRETGQRRPECDPCRNLYRRNRTFARKQKDFRLAMNRISRAEDNLMVLGVARTIIADLGGAAKAIELWHEEIGNLKGMNRMRALMGVMRVTAALGAIQR